MEYIIMFITHIIKICEAIAIDGLPPLTLGNVVAYSQYLVKLSIIYSSVFEQYIEKLITK